MEKVYKFNKSNDKLVEMILDNDEVAINHMILNQDDEMPIHNANSNVYMIIVNGVLSIQLNDGEVQSYNSGTLLNIEYGTKMHIYNADEKQVEFFVVKAPSPRLYNK